MKKSRFALFQSVIALLLCVSMLAGTTFAWFTDSVSSGTNTIAAGNLDIELEYRDANGTWHEVDESTAVLNNEAKWEPGHTEVAYLRISNAGNLALKYGFGVGVLEETGSINVNGEPFYLSEHIRFGIITSKSLVTYGTREEARNALNASQLISQGEISDDDTLKAADKERYVTLVVYMPEEIGNVANHATGVTPPEIKLGIQLTATQAQYESDSFGTDYDKNATLAGFNFPATRFDVTTSAGVTTDEANKVSAPVTLADEKTSAKIPEGVLLDNGTKVLTLEVSTMEQSGANIVLKENEDSISLDVHVDGVSKDNTQPMEITIQEVAPKGLNMGNYKFYHVENGQTKEMTLIANDAVFTEHNQFKYDPVTGDITLYMATFSEVALVADTENAWAGKFDYTWYDASKTELTIANADQLAAFGAIVGGMNGQIKNSFARKTVKLIADVNLGDAEEANNPDIIFYPIGYWNNEGTYERKPVEERETAVESGFYTFEGTFDGNGHTISNFYQNTWEMKGDHNWYDPIKEQYYRDGMGLFGKVYGGTVKNLTVKNFKSDGEIATTGVIAAYADGATFENIAIVECNPRVYNIGNGGIVGCVGWYAKEANLKTTFKNITVDNSNKISALWGSYDVPCGGIVGQYYVTSGQTSAGKPANGGIHFENCHISAQLDVNNDVCANYQYYAYRYAGMLIGSVSENETINGHVYPKMDGITASGCTVHFGTWNDYYYCEFEKNGHPSYSGPDDYKFSRIPHSEINFTDSNGNGIIDTEGERASVTGCKHGHTDAEDQRCVYLQFKNLVTGYGWGVTTKVVGELEGVTILDREVGNSKVKFEKSDTAKVSYMNGKPIQLGELFKAAELDDEKLSILSASVSVTVSPVGEDSTAGGSYVANTTDWTQGTLTLTGNGAATITITDYYFCTPTTITVKVTDRQPEEKFDIVMNNGDFLHRVGNASGSTVSLGTLFKEIATVTDASTTVDFMTIGGNASGSFTDNTSDWTKGTIQFSGTGVVKVTITDNDYCIPAELILEVIDAWNATSATNAPYEKNGQKYDVVLLNNVGAGSLTVKDGYTFYGNNFNMTFSGDGSYRSAAVSYGFVTVENGGVLDNVNIICDIFPESYVYTSEMNAKDGKYPYGYSAVVVSGNSTISNCDIEGARNNIQVGEGNVTIENTSMKNGSLSNIHIKSTDAYTVTLNNVTTEQNICTSKYDTAKKVYGFGILVGTNESTSNANLLLKGTLKQNNWISKADAENVSNDYAKTAITEAFNYTDYVNGDNKINTGIVFLNKHTASITDKRVDNASVTYKLSEITMMTYTGQVYSITDGTSSGENSAAGNKDVMPTIVFAGENENITTSKVLNNGIWETKLAVDLDKISGGSYTFSFDDVKVQKYGKDLDYTVKAANGNNVNKGTTITLNQLATNRYTLVVSDNQIYNNKGELTGEIVPREMPFILSATKTSIEPPKFTNASTATAIRLVEKKGGDWRPAYTVLTGVTVTYWSASESKVTTVDLSTLYNSGTISSNVWTYTCDDYTLTITGGQVHSDGTKITPVVSNNTLYFASTNKAFTTSTTSRDIILTYVFTDKNDSTTWNRSEKVQYSELSEYDYSSFKNGTLKEPSSGGSSSCITPDTLITLADGSQVRVDSLKGDEMLLVWNLETGKYDTAPIVFVDNEQESEYEIIHLYFSDGSDVKVIYEHGFFDLDLGEHVYIDANNYADYIGHRFVTEGDIKSNNWNVVTLDEVVIETEVTTAWSPVTFEHLCYYTNGVLSMPGGIEGLFNIFEVDTDLMRYDAVKMQKDIETFGLFTIEDFGGMITEDAFNAFNGAYLKVAIAKGILTWEDIAYMAERYIPLMK